tara:strand:- start:1181 stop:1417 length:237 start_codon:yes stop_codon:yes gene_type:complete
VEIFVIEGLVPGSTTGKPSLGIVQPALAPMPEKFWNWANNWWENVFFRLLIKLLDFWLLNPIIKPHWTGGATLSQISK